MQPEVIRLGASPTSSCAALPGDLLRLTFGYGAAANNGNVLTQTIARPSFAISQSYTYDAVNRLQSMTEGPLPQTYVYDRYGNRAVLAGSYMPNSGLTPQVTDTNPSSVEAIFPSNKWTGVTHGASGNQISRGGASFGYDAESRLASATVGTVVTDYSYDGEGRRVARKIGADTTTFVYDAFGKLAAEYGGAPSPSGRQYLTTDHLGSTRLVTNASGGDERCSDYLPFGEEIQPTANGRVACYATSIEPRQKFTGKERDAETGLDYFGARYFSGAQGRFTSPDRPLVDQIPSDPQSWNLYSYVRNNPLRRNDPTGLKCVDLDGGGQGDDGKPGKPCGKEAGLDLTHGVTVGSGGWSEVGVYGNAFLRGDLQSGRMDSAPGDLLLAYGAARGAIALGQGIAGRMGARAAQDVLIQGPYGAISKAALEAAANSGGSTIRVVTNLTQAPQAGQGLSTAIGQGAEALAAAARSGGQTYVANIPTQLVALLENAGLAVRSTKSMGGVTATEIRFYPAATEFIVKFFH